MGGMLAFSLSLCHERMKGRKSLPYINHSSNCGAAAHNCFVQRKKMSDFASACRGSRKMMASNFRGASLFNDQMAVLLDRHWSKLLSANRVQRTRINWNTSNSYSLTEFRHQQM